jgi:hypothetical protein
LGSFDPAAGTLLATLETGVEGGQAFALTTSFTPTPEGQTGALDPPGFGTSDVTTLTFDARDVDLRL